MRQPVHTQPASANTILRLWAVGNWGPGAVTCRWCPSSQIIPPSIQEEIDRRWNQATQSTGVKLFDGPLCRLESLTGAIDRLSLDISLARYKQFWGGQQLNASGEHPLEARSLTFPVGVSAALVSGDDQLVLGRRGTNVAFYPGWLHSFAGAFEPSDGAPHAGGPPDVFAAVFRELAEELNVSQDDIQDVRCAGLLEDAWLRQPELVFLVRTSISAAELSGRLDPAEHTALHHVPMTPDALASIALEPTITPVAASAALLWGRKLFGPAWFARQMERSPVRIEQPAGAWPAP